jgi:hypothetical protein
MREVYDGYGPHGNNLPVRRLQPANPVVPRVTDFQCLREPASRCIVQRRQRTVEVLAIDKLGCFAL